MPKAAKLAAAAAAAAATATEKRGRRPGCKDTAPRIRRTNAELKLGLVGNDKILAYRKETGCKPQKPAGIGKKNSKGQGRPKGSLNKSSLAWLDEFRDF